VLIVLSLCRRSVGNCVHTEEIPSVLSFPSLNFIPHRLSLQNPSGFSDLTYYLAVDIDIGVNGKLNRMFSYLCVSTFLSFIFSFLLQYQKHSTSIPVSYHEPSILTEWQGVCVTSFPLPRNKPFDLAHSNSTKISSLDS
jgi:hypothetical protein